MTNTDTITLEELAAVLVTNNCKAHELEDGWYLMSFELCCVTYEVEVRFPELKEEVTLPSVSGPFFLVANNWARTDVELRNLRVGE